MKGAVKEPQKKNLKFNFLYSISYKISDAGSTPASTFSEVQKARTAQALRAFLHLLPPGEDCREPHGH